MSRLTVKSERPGGGDAYWLDEFGVIAGLNYTTCYPGGDQQATWQTTLDMRHQHRAWDYGRLITLCAGATPVWRGYLDKPQRGTSWTMTAVGQAALAMQYRAVADTSGDALELDEVVDAAISRGLPFTRVGSLPTLANGSAPSASLSIDEALDQVAQGQTSDTFWSVDISGALSMGPAPSTPAYLLYANGVGGGRSLDGFATDVYVLYQSASGVISTSLRSATLKPYGTFEAYSDQTALGLIPAAQADDLGDGFLARNAARARFTDTFTVTRSQLVTTGGVSPDGATIRAGFLAKVIVLDPDSAGEVAGSNPQVLIGGTAYDSDSDTLTLTPVYSAQDNLTALLGAGQLVA